MCAMMYKHRPSYTALTGAVVTLFGGCLLMLGLSRESHSGEEVPASVLLAGCMTFLLFGVFLIVAFARYKYTHLWKKPKHAAHRMEHRHDHAHAHAHGHSVRR